MNGALQFPTIGEEELKSKNVRERLIANEIARKKAGLKPKKKLSMSDITSMSEQLVGGQPAPIIPQGAPQPIPGAQAPQAIPGAQAPQAGLQPQQGLPGVTPPSPAAPQAQAPAQKQDINELMTGSVDFISKPQGLRTLAMFMRPDAAVLLNKRADEKEAQQAVSEAQQLKAFTKFKPEFIKGVGVFDPNTKQVIPGTSPKELGQPVLDPIIQFKQEGQLRDKFQALTKEFRQVRDSYTRVVASGKDPSAAGDLALIFNFMKVLDPGSVVRESEFATAQNSGGVDDRTRAAYNRVLNGERLAPRIRNDFLDRGRRLFKGKETQYGKTSTEYRKLAKAYNLDSSRVVLDLGIVEPDREGVEQKEFKGIKEKDLSDEERKALQAAGHL